MVIFDLDDFITDGRDVVKLYDLKEKFPSLKVTLFTILGNCGIENLKKFHEKTKDWIELAAHGMTHHSNHECLLWDRKTWFDVLNLYEESGLFTKVFKAPNWEMSKLGYYVLKDFGWGVAVRGFQIDEIPKGLKYYSFEEDKQPHGHIWLLESHEQDGMFKNWKDKKFDFISNNLKTK